MTSKSSFWKISLWNMKKRMWTALLCLVVCFFMFPVASFINGGYYVNYMSQGTSYTLDYAVNGLLTGNIMGDGFFGVAAVVMGVFLSLQSFSWINSRSKVDLYKSVPVKSSTRFLYINLNSLYIFVITFGLNLILANIAIAIRGFWKPVFIAVSLYSFLLHLLLFMGSYLLTLIAQLLTGNLVLGFFGGAILLGIEPAVFFVKNLLMSQYYHTFLSEGRFDFAGKGIFSPCSAYIGAYKNIAEAATNFSDLSNYAASIGKIILLLVQIIVYVLLAYFLYQKRPAQNGGKSLIFKPTKPIIKCVIMIVTSLLAACAFGSLGGHPFWYGVFGAVCSLIILQVILQSIIEGDFKESLKGKLSFAISAVITMAIFLVIATDMTGYDRYLPKSEKLESFAVVRDGDWVNNYYNRDGAYVSNDDYLLGNMKIDAPEVKEQLLSVLQKAIESDEYYDDNYYGVAVYAEDSAAAKADIVAGAYPAEEETELFAEDGEASVDESQEAKEITYDASYSNPDAREQLLVQFNLKNGKQVCRRYYLKISDIRALEAGYYNLPQYSEVKYPILSEYVKNELTNSEKHNNVSYHAYSINATLGDGSTANQDVVNQLYDAICKDLKARTYEMVLNEAPIGQLSFQGNYDIYDGSDSVYQTVPVYESDENVVSLLKENGWYKDVKLDEDLVNAISITQSLTDSDGYKELVLKKDDPLFKAVVDALISQETTNAVSDSSFVKGDYWVELGSIADDDSETGFVGTYSCQMLRVKFPAELVERFKDVEEKQYTAY